MKKLTFEDRKNIEKMWKDNASPIEIAAALSISQACVYAELKRGRTFGGDGELEIDENMRARYTAEQGEKVYHANLRNRGRRPAGAAAGK